MAASGLCGCGKSIPQTISAQQAAVWTRGANGGYAAALAALRFDLEGVKCLELPSDAIGRRDWNLLNYLIF